ncbi:MAG: glycosyltransferase [bacterium]
MTRRRTRVVFSLDSLGVGGTEMNAVRVAEHLDPSRFHVSVACFSGDGPLRQRFSDAEVPIDVFPVTSLYGSRMISEGLRFMRFLRRERVDIVHAHDRYANVFAVPWARLARTKAVIASKRWGSASRLHSLGNRAAYAMAHRVIANSNTVGASLVAEDGVAQHRVVVVPNFVEDEAFELPSAEWLDRMRRELALPDHALVVGIVASFRAIKDHATLVRAIAQLRPRFPNLVLVMMGAGPTRPDLESLAAELGISDMMRFAGIHPNRPNPHRLFDVSVLCSLSEGFPNTIVEAMAAARPVVATLVGGVPDAVEHGRNGLLVAARDDRALASALEELLVDATARDRMGAAGQEIARNRFTAARVIPLLTDLYAQLLSPRTVITSGT